MSLIHIEKPTEECVNFAGMRGSGKSNAMGYMLKQLPKGTKYILVDTAHAFRNFSPNDPLNQQVVRFRKDLRLKLFEELLEKVYQQKNMILAVDEIDRYETVYKMPSVLDDLINIGRNYSIALWVAFRRPARVHKDLIGNADHHFIFKLFDVASIKWYKDATGCDWIEKARDLKPYHFFYWKVGSDPVPMKPLSKVI